MTEITLFRFEGKPLEAAHDTAGEIIFDAADVCRILDLAHVGSALRVLDEDEKGVRIKHTLGGEQKAAFVTEPGLYKLISRSRKPEAKRFDRWVRHEVLPQIRKTGSYNAAPAIDLNDPAFLRQTLLGYTEKVIALEAEKAILAPKAEVADKIAESAGLYTLNLSAKAANMPLQQFVRAAHANGFIFKQRGKWNAYAEKVKAGFCHVKFHPYRDRDGDERFSPQVFFTPKGITRLVQITGQH